MAARLRREDYSPVSGVSNIGNFVLVNNSDLPVSVQLTQSADYSPSGTDSTGNPSGTRYNLGPAVTLVPGGTTTLQLQPYMQYLEVWGSGSTATPNGTLTMDITSTTRWARLSFAKTDTQYYANLWNAAPQPLSTNIPGVPVLDL